MIDVSTDDRDNTTNFFNVMPACETSAHENLAFRDTLYGSLLKRRCATKLVHGIGASNFLQITVGPLALNY